MLLLQLAVRVLPVPVRATALQPLSALPSATKLTLPPENPPRQVTTIGGRNPLTGAKIENLSPAVATELQMDLLARGVVVVSSGQSIAAQQGFQPGDIVRAVNGSEIHSIGELNRALANAGGHWDMIIERGNQRLTLSMEG